MIGNAWHSRIIARVHILLVLIVQSQHFPSSYSRIRHSPASQARDVATYCSEWRSFAPGWGEVGIGPFDSSRRPSRPRLGSRNAVQEFVISFAVSAIRLTTIIHNRRIPIHKLSSNRTILPPPPPKTHQHPSLQPKQAKNHPPSQPP